MATFRPKEERNFRLVTENTGAPQTSLDFNKIKLGNGTSKWSELEYMNNFDDVIIDCGTSTTNI